MWVEIDSVSEGGAFRVKFPNGRWETLTAEELPEYGLPVPQPPWSLGWVDAEGNPVLDDLTYADVESLANCIKELASIGEFVDSNLRRLNVQALAIAAAFQDSMERKS